MGHLSISGKLSEHIPLLQPLIEITGINRVLVEHHSGIAHYSLDTVTVRMSYGCLKIAGSDLTVSKISREQLIISGEIDELLLIGGAHYA